MSIPSELKSSTRRMIEQVLVCRPYDSISYAVQYYYDEKCANPTVNHAIHSLLFLIRKPVDFRSAIGTIYCAETAATASSSFLGKGQISTSGNKEDKDTDATSKIEKSADNSDPESGRDTPTAEIDLSPTEEVIGDSMKQLNNLCRIARLAIASYDGSLAVAAGNSRVDLLRSPLEPIPGTEDKMWLFNLVEKSLRKEPMTEAVSLDYETYISFLRLYLGLWTVVVWFEKAVRHLWAMNSNNVKLESLFKDILSIGNNAATGIGNEDAVLSRMVLEEDEDVLRKLLAGVYNTCNNEEKEDIEKVVTRCFEQYVEIVL